MKRISLAAVVAGAVLGWAAVASADPYFFDSFDAYATGSQMHGQGGWKGWDNVPAAGALTSSAQSFSPANSVAITGGSDLVHEWTTFIGGKWKVSAKQYVPSTSNSGTTYYLLLNQYNDGGPYDWSSQLSFDLGAGTVKEDLPTSSPTRPIVRDRWVDITEIVDLDANNVKVYYDGTLLADHVWYGNSPAIRAIDLYAGGAPAVFYDNVSISAIPEPSTLALMAVGLAAAPFVVRRLRRRKIGA